MTIPSAQLGMLLWRLFLRLLSWCPVLSQRNSFEVLENVDDIYCGITSYQVSPAVDAGWHLLHAVRPDNGLQSSQNQLIKLVRRVGCYTDVSSYREVLINSELLEFDEAARYHMYMDSNGHHIKYVSYTYHCLPRKGYPLTAPSENLEMIVLNKFRTAIVNRCIHKTVDVFLSKCL